MVQQLHAKLTTNTQKTNKNKQGSDGRTAPSEPGNLPAPLNPNIKSAIR